MLGSNIWNLLSECKQMINTEKKFVLEYLEPFNCVQPIVMLLSKEISSDWFKNKIHPN